MARELTWCDERRPVGASPDRRRARRGAAMTWYRLQTLAGLLAAFLLCGVDRAHAQSCPPNFVDVSGTGDRACLRKVEKVTNSLSIGGVTWHDQCQTRHVGSPSRYRAVRNCKADNSVDYASAWQLTSQQHGGLGCEGHWAGANSNDDCGEGGSDTDQGKEWIWALARSSPTLPNVYAAKGQVVTGNVDQTSTSSTALATTHDLATSFATGAGTSTLTSLELRLVSGTGTTPPAVTLHSGSATGTKVATFTGPFALTASTTANYTFTPGSSVSLTAYTTYWVVVEGGRAAWPGRTPTPTTRPR